MKTTMRKSDTEARHIAASRAAAQKKEGTEAVIEDNRHRTLAQMKLLESLQAKEDIQLTAGPEEEEELPIG